MSRCSPALRHQREVLARQAAAAAPHGGHVQGSAYEVTLAQLVEHRRTLKDIQSVERKIEAKATMLPAYDAWIDGALQAGNGAQDEVLTTVLVWHIDVGNYARALQIARYVVQHGLQMPDRYERGVPVVLIDEYSIAALTGRMPHELALQVLPEVLQLTAEHDAPDQARAKLHKAIGYALIRKSGSADVDVSAVAEPVARTALGHLQRALHLHDLVGVKKDIERLERRLRPAAPG
ncbi:phage terminase small subunit [Azohydromonas lata]|uniref:Phage terminase small subunit n=1 Tax=Azohydromonas lata TaxID=45677 RepID=A0ABU5IDH7_9BURK|nr:phage terminase small subunit [Azohydromonas lata]MDZ5457012.1 phage terminase small subunit [Azohydromonas lata]